MSASRFGLADASDVSRPLPGEGWRPSVFFLKRVPSRPLPWGGPAPQPARDLGTGHLGRARDSAFPASARRNQMRGPGGNCSLAPRGTVFSGKELDGSPCRTAVLSGFPFGGPGEGVLSIKRGGICRWGLGAGRAGIGRAAPSAFTRIPSTGPAADTIKPP